MRQLILPYKPFPKQCEFHASDAPYRLFGGSAGPGKSEAILWEGVIKCLVKPKTNGVLFRRTYPELEMSLIRRFQEKCPQELYSYNIQNHLATFKNASTLQFAYCDSDNDVYRYQSAEFDFIGVDELTHFSEYFFTYIISRLRTVKADIKPSFFAATNPGNRGHLFVKDRWVEKTCKAEGYDPKDYDFIRATIQDNPILIQNDPGYLMRLENLPEQQKKALLHGSFDVFEGQYFSEWFDDVHVVDPHELPASWKRIRAIDHGRTAPTACMWGAIDHDGRVVWYREYYAAGLDADVNASEIAKLSLGEQYAWTVLDSACYSKTGAGETIAEIYERNGVMAIPSPKHRIHGWALMHEYLRHSPKEKPRMVFWRNCVNAVRTIPTLVHDTHHPEDLDSGGDDHIADVCRYALAMLHEAKSPTPLDPLQTFVMKHKEQSRVNPANLSRFYANRKR